ncbi:MAG: class I SAM-dependent rRNA methyltransferase [Candidatus Peribacteraceae bacterium]|nr:class I SAM-dependent rRNA methyltransferase [Candidatus Peribacteraceae bacterium]
MFSNHSGKRGLLVAFSGISAYPVITLKPERDWPLRNHHHAIYKTAVAKMPEVKNGGIAEVRSDMGDFLCFAMINIHAYICGRAVSFDEKEDPMAVLRRNIEQSVALRRRLISADDTNAVRLINAEGDGIPGLIVDRYADVLVLQITTLGMDRLREWIVDLLWNICKPKAIYEKSTSSARKNERIDPVEGWIRGEADDAIIVTERGVKFEINLIGSQKTGLFLDQREMRTLVRSYAKGKTVLDCCSYVGGFSVNALVGGALAADAVDYDVNAIAQAKKHVEMNGIDPQKFGSYSQDVFDFLRRKPLPRAYDFIVLDPPAFAKRSTDLEPAKKAYTDLNRLAMEILPKEGGLLLTCSCSYQVDPPLFQTIVFHAARQAKRSARILQRHRMAVDHPVNIYHPETDYLKSLLLWIG